MSEQTTQEKPLLVQLAERVGAQHAAMRWAIAHFDAEAEVAPESCAQTFRDAAQDLRDMEARLSELLHENEFLRACASHDERRITALEAALQTVTCDAGECRFDHHGFCQAHLSKPCAVADARRLVSDSVSSEG